MAYGYYLVKNKPAEEAFELRPIPHQPTAPHTIRIAVEAFGLNFADVMARLGQYRECPPLPAIIGYEVVGHATEVGSSVTHVQQGDRVLAFTRFGGYAQEVVTDGRGVVPIPDDWTPGKATALATQYATAWYSAMVLTNIFPKERVLIHAAAGGVGQALVQIALHRGAEIFGTAGSDKKIEHLKAMGVHHPINYQHQDFAASIRQILGDSRLDVVFDAIGGRVSRQSFRLLGSGGRHIHFGAAALTGKKNLWHKIRWALQTGFYHPAFLMMRSKSILGVNMLKIGDFKPDTLQQVIQDVVEATKKGILHPGDGQVFPHTKLAEAHRMLEKRATTGKVAIRWED